MNKTKHLCFMKIDRKYQWDAQHLRACQVISLIKQTEQQCLAEWSPGSGKANRCVFLSFSTQQQLPGPIWTRSIQSLVYFYTLSPTLWLLQDLCAKLESLHPCVEWKPALSTIGRWFPPLSLMAPLVQSVSATFGQQLKWAVPTW